MSQQSFDDSAKVCFQTKHADWQNAYMCAEALAGLLTENIGPYTVQTVLIDKDHLCIQTQAINWRISFAGSVQRKLFCEDTWKMFSLEGDLKREVYFVLMNYFNDNTWITDGIYSYVKEIPVPALHRLIGGK